MNYEKIFSFLEAQKRHNLELDEAEGKIDREREGKDKPGLRKEIYELTLGWIKRESLGMLEKEFSKLDKAELNEDTLSTNIATFTTAMLPAVRRIYNKLIAMDLVSIQPLNGPTGIIYWLDHTFGTTGGGATAGQRLDQYRYNDYANSLEQGTIREVNFAVSQKTVTAVTKKIKGNWTIEAEQDLKSQYNLNLESELMPKIVEEVVREIDGQVIADLEGGVAHNVTWNANGYLAGDTATYERKAYDETLKDAIMEANNEVYKVKFRNCNWLVMDADTYLRLSKLESFNVDALAQENMGDFGRRYVGNLSGGMFKVYVDPDFTANKILMGFKGDNWQYAVGYYAPYIPLFTSEKYIISDDFTQFAKGAMTRYAHGIIPETSVGTTNNGLATVTITLS